MAVAILLRFNVDWPLWRVALPLALGKTALFVENHIFPTFSHFVFVDDRFCSIVPLHFAVRTCSKPDHVVWPNISASQITKHAIAKKKNHSQSIIFFQIFEIKQLVLTLKQLNLV